MKTKKRNPQDATLRNIRSLKSAVRELRKGCVILANVCVSFKNRIETLERKVHFLETLKSFSNRKKRR